MFIFIYGSLKTDKENHDILRKFNARYVGTGTTKRYFYLIKHQDKNYPYAVLNSYGYNIQGEIYDINYFGLSEIDRFENHPDYFTRHLEWIHSKENDRDYLCNIYFIDKKKILEKIFENHEIGKLNSGYQYLKSDTF